MAKTINEAQKEEVTNRDVQPAEDEQSNVDERIDAVEKVVASQSKQISDIANEQEKIVDILENISEKVSESNKSEILDEKVEENSLETNDAGEAAESEPAAEAEAPAEEAEEQAEEEKEEEEEEKPEEEEEKADEKEAEEEEEPEAEDKDEEESEDVDEESKDEESEEESDEEAEEAPAEEESEDDSEETDKEAAEEKEPQDNNDKDNKMTEEQINALKESIKNEILDAQVEAPKVEETEEAPAEDEPAVEKNWRKRYNQQVAAAWNAFRLHNVEAAEELARINKFNAQLKVKNSDTNSDEVMTIESLADFVLPPEIDKMIHGKRTNYAPFLSKIEYVKTDNLQFAYATRIGDIDMQNVALCDDGDDGNLKPISTYKLQKGVAQMEEMAAVTPICDNATKYLAADILSDVAAGYRTDYDRKLAQLAIVRMQQAINASGNVVTIAPGATSIDKLVDFIKATTKVSDAVVNGTFVFTAKTKAALVEYMFRAGEHNELGHDTITTGEFPTIFGYPYIVVPNDLMPTLGEGDTKTFKATNNQTGEIESVSITSPVFYGDLDEYRGKTSGALKYDVSADASYETEDGTVKSAWQRNELVLRGSFLRGGYIADSTAFAGLAPAHSS